MLVRTACFNASASFAPRSAAVAGLERAGLPAASSDYEIRGELQLSDQSWTLRARMIKAGTGEVQSVVTASVNADEADMQLQQSRLVAGVGHVLARRLNEMLEPSTPSARTRGSSAGGDKVAVEQALASITQTTRERFGAAQSMLQKALTEDPDNVDLAVALASLQMRGIQMVWFNPDEAVVVEARANATLEQALRSKPNSIPVLEAYCRFLSATNHFVESLVTCAKALSFDPWNGAALYLIGLGEIYLGRFDDALATFHQADRYDTPPASRWTWLLGAGLANLLTGRDEEALPWLQRSIAITPATGRSHMLLAVAYQRLGRFEEARAAIEEGLRLAARHDEAQRLAADEERKSGLSRSLGSRRSDHGRRRLAGAMKPACASTHARERAAKSPSCLQIAIPSPSS